MKMNFAKKRFLILALISSIFLSINANAGWFFESEKKILLKQANAAYELAIKASEEGRINDAFALFSDAGGKYAALLNTYPKYETEHVTQALNNCGEYLKTIREKVSSGEIVLPPFGQESESDKYPTKDEQKPVIKLSNEPSTGVSSKAGSQLEANLKPTTGTVVKKTSTPAKEEAALDIPQETETEASSIQLSPENPLANGDEKACIRIINGLLDSRNQTDAVYYIDELIDARGESTPISIRCLYVKALISLGNKNMAASQLAILEKQAPKNPSVRSLVAALAIANGDLMEAMLQLDKLIEENPKYAEARINYAYLLLMIDPSSYRKTAIDSYKLALKLGAKRDQNLEKNLNIVIE
jgi:Flp pilus assembly protein TadD